MSTLSLFRAEQIRALDRSAIEQHGIPGYTLMCRAAEAALRYLRERWPAAQSIVVVCGNGNNGGDGYALARLARQVGLLTICIGLDEQLPSTPTARRAHQDYLVAGGLCMAYNESLALPAADVYVDALFGIGLSRDVEGRAAALIGALNATSGPVLALDLPSGLCADSGAVLGAAVRAVATVSFIAHKRGLFTGAASDHVGNLLLDHLATPAALFDGISADATTVDSTELYTSLRPRRRCAHKGDFGHVLVVGGDYGMAGAARMAAEAALRCGAGRVSLITRVEHAPSIVAARPEIMARGANEGESLAALIGSASHLALGPGLGSGAWSRFLFDSLVVAGLPMVIDADALNLLAQTPHPLGARAVITPHPGEAARLLDVSTAEIQRDRYAAVRALAARFGAVSVLKGAGTLIAASDGRVSVARGGNPGMASGGMGDVLTGVIAALMAQGLTPWDAAQLGVAVHAEAGDCAAREGERGMVASDLFAYLRLAVNPGCAAA